MKKLTLLIAACIISCSLYSQPASFSWGASPSENQKITGPCHIFASVSAVETWHKILYGSGAELSQSHIFSPCAGNDPVSTSIPSSLSFFKNTGVVEDAFMPYTNSGPCHAGGIYFNTFMTISNSSMVDCGTPWSNCTPNSSLPSVRYRIGDFAELPIATYAGNNQLKRAIMNSGPIAMWFSTPSLYGGQNHAYCLYGWDATGKWLLTDSHENGTGSLSTTLDILNLFKQNSTFKAHVLKNTASKPAVYKQDRQPGTPLNNWTDNLPSINCTQNFSNLFSISGPAAITNTAPGNYNISGLEHIDGETIEWSYETVQGLYTYGAVTFSGTTNPTTTVSMQYPGKVKIKAKITWPNGICATVSTGIVDVMSYAIVKTHDWCLSGTKREIQYQVTSATAGMSLTGVVYPSPGVAVTQSSTGTLFTFTLNPVPTGYGLILTVKAPNGASIGSHTMGGSASACFGFRSAATVKKAVTLPETISIFPDPVKDILSVIPSVAINYRVRIVDIFGRTMIQTNIQGMTKIDVSHLATGLYTVYFTGVKSKQQRITKKFLKQ
jgi:Secretion system C-terminal sorting domain/Papain family cysteine protease